MQILFLHIFSTFSSIILGYFILLISKKPLLKNKPLALIFGLLLICSAITGYLFNPYSFSPFHFLAIVTIVTTPIAIYFLLKGNNLKARRGFIYNFIGLNIAMVGALEPDRYLGRRLELGFNVWAGLFVVSLVVGGVVAWRVGRKGE
jgi:uncharacterized membrane protein